MARTVMLLAFLGLICYVSGSTSIITPSAVLQTTATVTPSTLAKQTTVMSTPVVTVAPTSTPAPKVPQEEYRIVNPKNNKTCFLMTAQLELHTTYNMTSGGNATVQIPVDNNTNVVDSSSSCSDKEIVLVLKWTHNDSQNTLFFNFNKTDKSWASQSVNFTFVPGSELFPNFTHGEAEKLEAITKDPLFQTSDANRNFNQSYSCAIERNLTYTGKDYISVLGVISLRVQAFEFKTDKGNATEFDDAYTCSTNRGNKIVPIAVGAALAGLVIVVLIAYLIGRLKRRNQGSYEALS